MKQFYKIIRGNIIKIWVLRALKISLLHFIILFFTTASIHAQAYYGYPFAPSNTGYFPSGPGLWYRGDSAIPQVVWSDPVYGPDYFSNPYSYGSYGPPYGGPPNFGYGPGYYNYRQPSFNQPHYNAPYNWYGLNQPYDYGGYPYQSGGFAWGPGSYYPGYGYSQPPYYGAYPYQPGGFRFAPGAYYPRYLYSPAPYEDADVELALDDTGDEITLDKGETLSIILPSYSLPTTNYVDVNYQWKLDTDELDEDVIKKKSSNYFPEEFFTDNSGLQSFSGHEQWIFEAEDVGTTTIRITSSYGMDNVEDHFEIEVTVVE